MGCKVTGRALLVFGWVLGLCIAAGAWGSPQGAMPSKVRTYYVAADEVDWDYAPSGLNKMMGMKFDGYAATFIEKSPHRIGKVYRKAIYREYTDETFTKLKPRPADQEYLGMLGPVLRAEVGDTIKVVFRNNATRPYSMHPHGVFYGKDSEGTMNYDDGSSRPNSHVQLAGDGACWTWPQRSQFDRVALPLARGRDEGRREWSDWPNHHYPAWHARPRGPAQGRRP
jgi:FtsP/CotA-like multicopper oxidase with cupredoxin domain